MSLADGRVESTLVSPKVARELVANLDGIRQFMQRFGTMQSMELVDRYDDYGDRVFRYRVRSDAMSVVFKVRVGPQGTITDFGPED